MTDLEESLDRAFKKRIRIAVENERQEHSSSWIFWGNQNDFYFGAKSAAAAIKISLHSNGLGYVGYDKKYFNETRGSGFELPQKSVTEWKLPTPSPKGAVQVASLFLPADFCNKLANADSRLKKTLVLQVAPKHAAEIMIFYSREGIETLEGKFLQIGHPLFAVGLENGLLVSMVARLSPFDPNVLPSTEQMSRSRMVPLVHPDEIDQSSTFNGMFWNKPDDGGVLQIVDIGGISIQRNQPPASGQISEE